MDDLISRQAAIEAVQNRHIMLNKEKVLLINDLEKLPPAEFEKRTETHGVCLDAISRQAAIEAFNTNLDELVVGGEKNAKTVENYLNRVLDKIKCLPPEEPKRIKGKWVGADTQCGIACSVCGVAVDDFCHSVDYIDLDYEPNFCPNCGAKMEAADGND